MLTVETPSDWQGLQTMVGTILSECGMTVELEKLVKTARGAVRIDVYAEELISGRKHTILCECKYWGRAVPQAIIHGFRAVVGDIGANTGYIISIGGFQSGAFDASQLTNVELLTWDEFQEAFQATWIEAYMIPQVTEQLDPLLSYVEPLLPKWYSLLSSDDKADFDNLKHQYIGLGAIAMIFTSYMQTLGTSIRALPLSSRDAGYDYLPRDVADATGYRDLFALILRYGEEAISKFRVLRDRTGFQVPE
jgi:restriction system protein